MRKREETVRADAIAETAAETPGREAFCEKIDRRDLTALPLSPAGSSAPYADFWSPQQAEPPRWPVSVQIPFPKESMNVRVR